MVGELHSLTDWHVSEASDDAELDDFYSGKDKKIHYIFALKSWKKLKKASKMRSFWFSSQEKQKKYLNLSGSRNSNMHLIICTWLVMSEGMGEGGLE